MKDRRIRLGLFTLLALALSAWFGPCGGEWQDVCGDGLCDSNESSANCPRDCPCENPGSICDGMVDGTICQVGNGTGLCENCVCVPRCGGWENPLCQAATNGDPCVSGGGQPGVCIDCYCRSACPAGSPCLGKGTGDCTLNHVKGNCWACECNTCTRGSACYNKYDGDFCVTSDGQSGRCQNCDCRLACQDASSPCAGRLWGDRCLEGGVIGICTDCDCTVCPETSDCHGIPREALCQTSAGLWGLCDDNCSCVPQCADPGAVCYGHWEGSSCEVGGVPGDCRGCRCCLRGSDFCESDSDCGSPVIQCNDTCNCVSRTRSACAASSDGCTSDSFCQELYGPAAYCDSNCNCLALGEPDFPAPPPPAPGPAFCPEGSACATEYFEVYHCKRVGDAFEWYEVEVDYVDGQPVTERIVGGPHTSAEWRPFCPSIDEEAEDESDSQDGEGCAVGADC